MPASTAEADSTDHDRTLSAGNHQDDSNRGPAGLQQELSRIAAGRRRAGQEPRRNHLKEKVCC